ncbi:hypothetical protein MTO96_002058 [Rhipicephalus appendiculatus]
MADALRTLAVLAAALLALLAEASGAQMGMGAGCVPGQCLAQCQSVGSGVGTCAPQGCICGAAPGGPHEPCNVLKCDRQCRMDSRKPLMNARCAPQRLLQVHLSGDVRMTVTSKAMRRCSSRAIQPSPHNKANFC